MSKIYTVTHANGKKVLVRAETNAGALKHERAKLVVSAEVTSQDELIELTQSGVKVENATAQADAGDPQ